MTGVDEARAPDRWAPRRLNFLRDVQHPGELTHHALLRDVEMQTFPWAIRELHRRLYDGAPAGNEQKQCIALRRGFPVQWSAWLGVLGWFLLTLLLVTGSDLGRGFQLLDGNGSTAQSAVPVISFPVAESLVPWLFGLAVLLLGVSLLMSLCSRRQFFLVAQQNAENSLDLWISGSSWRCEPQFDREFASFVASIQLQQRTTIDVPQTSNQGL